MAIVQIYPLEKRVAIVDAPSTAINPTVSMGYLLFKTRNEKNGIPTPHLADYGKLQKYLSKHDPGKDWNDHAIKLPPGKWRLLSVSGNLTEEQAAELVEYRQRDTFTGMVAGWNDYCASFQTFDTALESWRSFMQLQELTHAEIVLVDDAEVWAVSVPAEPERFAIIQKFMDANRKWTDDTFGPLSAVSALKHLKKEVGETIDAIEQSEPEEAIRAEFSDCFLLLLNACHKHGISFSDLFAVAESKMKINRERKWGQVNSEGFVEHLK